MSLTQKMIVLIVTTKPFPNFLPQNRFNGNCNCAGNTHIRINRISYGVGIAGSYHQRTGHRQIQGRIQSIFTRLLAQLLLHTVWSTISKVQFSASAKLSFLSAFLMFHNLQFNETTKVCRSSFDQRKSNH